MFNKPKFWDKKIGLNAVLFIPLSLIFLFIVFLKKRFTKVIKFKIPIICIGNIYIGGTGKTPTSIKLANELDKLGKKPVILRKYYKNHIDEYELIKEYFKNLIVKKNRKDGILEAEKSNFNTIILDDGLQDYKINKNLKIVCFNKSQLVGNGLLLPSGPLRESMKSLKDADIVIINGKSDRNFEEKILKINERLQIFYSFYEPVNIEQFKNKKLLVIAGIANPENFLRLLEESNLKIEKKLIFPDHYKFSKNQIQNILEEAKKNDYQVLMTEKDYFKIKSFEFQNIKYLKVILKINNLEKLLKSINKIYDKNH